MNKYYELGTFNYWDYDFEIRFSDGQLSLTKYLGRDKVIFIPGDISGKLITKITNKSFQNNKHVKVVILSEGILDIDSEAFLGTECVTLYTNYEKDECNFDHVLNVTVRYGLKDLIAIDHIHYAVFTNNAIIYNHSTLDMLYDSHGRMGEDIMLEDEVKGKPVTMIDNYALSNIYNIRRILLPTYLKEINQFGLANATMLEYIHFNDHLTHIHQHALEGCRELGLVIIQKSIESVSDLAFNKCPKATIFLESFHFVDYGKKWNGNAPYYDGFEKVVMVDSCEYGLLKDGRAILVKGYIDNPLDLDIFDSIFDEGIGYKVTEISAGAFEGQRNLNSIKLPESLEYIHYSALKNTSIKEIIIPRMIGKLSESVLEGNVNLEKVVIEGNMVELDDRALAENLNLSEIKIPDTVRRIGIDCFLNNENLTELDLPSELELLAEGSLLGTNIEFILVPLGVVKLGAFVFGAMNDLKKIILLNDNITIDDNWITELGDIDIYYFGEQRKKFESRLIKLSNGNIKFHLVNDEESD